jgi:hypothetical protein
VLLVDGPESPVDRCLLALLSLMSRSAIIEFDVRSSTTSSAALRAKHKKGSLLTLPTAASALADAPNRLADIRQFANAPMSAS